MRRAVEESGLSRAEISRGSGVAESQLSRFVRREHGMSVENLERLAEHLGLEIVIRPKRRARKAK